jgi:glycerophosphoryl diester phosphodiesterase
VDSSRRPLVIAHRGASGYRPEHTRAAYELGFTLGADAVEPDIVATSDGVLVIRHENEIGGTTNVSSRREFAGRKTTKIIDGVSQTGWFTEDFTWAELSTLRAVERLPQLRQSSSTFDGRQGILRLADLLELIDAASIAQLRALTMVAEIKHASYFESIGLPLDELFAAEVAHWATEDNLIVESFEQSVLLKIRGRGTPGKLVFLAEAKGAPADLVKRNGANAKTYEDHLTAAGLGDLAQSVDGISVNKRTLLRKALEKGPIGELINRAHDVGLFAFCWTLRAENRFLSKPFRRGGNAADFGDWLGEFSLLISSGVDGVFADQPDLVVSLLDAIESGVDASGPA